MCRISEEIYNEGLEQGLEQGVVNSLRGLMDTMKMNAQEALAALKVSESEWAKYLALL